MSKKGLWVAIKRDKVWADIFYRGEKIATISVSDQNRGNVAVINLEAPQDISFKIIKAPEPKEMIEKDESIYNNEIYNR